MNGQTHTHTLTPFSAGMVTKASQALGVPMRVVVITSVGFSYYKGTNVICVPGRQLRKNDVPFFE